MPRKNQGPEYWQWQAMIRRCLDPANSHYARYGGRGISVCERWRWSFRLFLEDMGPRPSMTHSIDRINNGGNYEPGNCRWATPKEQRRNNSFNHLLTLNGETLTTGAWADRIGIRTATILSRLRLGWTVEEALTTPIDRATSGPRRRLTINGVTKTPTTWARENGVSAPLLSYRLKHGWPVERAVSERPRAATFAPGASL